MATHVASDPLAGGDTRSAHQEPAGASYAHAVLNFRTNDNKENIHEGQKDAHPRPSVKTALQENQQNPPEAADPAAADDGDSFTPVVSHSRKDRKNEKNRREKLREANNKQLVNGNGEKREAKEQPEKERDEEKEAPKPKVFVEAPLPKVNPWQVNKNAAQIVATTEKRVLQPPKQETTVNGQAPQAVVCAPKDRRRYNQKVSGLIKSRLSRHDK